MEKGPQTKAEDGEGKRVAAPRRIVLLHGCAGLLPDMLKKAFPEAETPDSLGVTWETTLRGNPTRDGWVLGKSTVDILIGFSDGATTALSLAARFPNQVGCVLAFSPGGSVGGVPGCLSSSPMGRGIPSSRWRRATIWVGRSRGWSITATRGDMTWTRKL